MIEKYALALTPSLQLLDPKPLPRDNLTLFSAALKNEAPSYKPYKFKPLRSAGTELDKINEQIPSQVQLIDEEFKDKKLKSEFHFSSSSVVHLITHGQFSSNREKTFILTWDKPLNITELRNLLRTRDKIHPPIELLVLSACETLKGDERAALGLAGVAVRAGARSTLATLWQVNDQSTAEFMGLFYQELITNKKSKAEALRTAQLNFLRRRDYKNHPYYWAPFVLVGNWL